MVTNVIIYVTVRLDKRLEMGIQLSKILGTTKDKILVGTWCEHSQRVILNANLLIYAFYMQVQQYAD
ncbi:unnamed protein product [Rotaria sp. Silwood2]|nr:unnamed protein product [Rotaria sp. Silwood2]CAF3901126.1 unnamed protein product [Rotaria sp. Silwood2]CAF4094680.1 unnamed protein product [Rotaria sp. Silwood2]